MTLWAPASPWMPSDKEHPTDAVLGCSGLGSWGSVVCVSIEEDSRDLQEDQLELWLVEESWVGSPV